MKILVTGSTGVIGRRVVPLLLQRGHDVTAAGRSRERLMPLTREGASPLTLDIFDASAVAAVVPGHDVVINVATSIPPSTRALLPGAWRATARVRRVASRVLADAAIAAGVQRFVQESFAPMYADAGDRWIDESFPIQPARYNRSVVDAEASAQRVTDAGAVGVVLRFSYFYDLDSDFSADTARLVRRGWAPPFGHPASYISSVTHDDAAAAVVAALDVPAGIYNVSDDEPLTRRDFYDALAASLRVRPPRFLPQWMRYLGGSVGELLSRSQRISNGRFRAAAPGWAPRYPSARDGWRAIAPAIR
ncbi:MAG TPA: NAD(P)-dependent oxidoreductase [Gemmatimonadaceae bacterium]|nr:NAD(P)-dependent oxidoreductase [Gemmatimonadaceae bacterium]